MRGAAITLALLASAAQAGSVYIHEAHMHSDEGIREYDVETGLLIREGESSGTGYDLAVSPDGTLHVGGRCIVRYDWSWPAPPPLCWIGTRRGSMATDLSFRINGELIATEERTDPPSLGFTIISPDGTTLATHRPPSGYGIFGLDVPRSGPYENGVIALATETVAPGRYFLFRWREELDGTLVREGPIGPLDLTDYWTCAGSPFGCAIHPAMRRDGQSFLLPDPRRHEVREFDLEGREIGVFAAIPEDTTLPPGTRDVLTNLAVDADDRVLVLTGRHAYYFEADGTLIRRFDDILRTGTAVAFAEWIPFASEGVSCEPRSVGFWKRQCASLGLSRRATRTRLVGGSVLPVPPIHPEFRDGRLEGVIRRADAWLDPFGTSSCEALHPGGAIDWRQKALRRWATVALNVEDKRLGRRCTIEVDGVDRPVADLLDDVRGLLSSVSEEDHREAFRLCGWLLHEEGE